METIEMKKEERNILVGHLVGIAFVMVLFLAWPLYLLSIMKFSWDRFKAVATGSPESLVYFFVPLIMIFVWIPKLLKVYKDIKLRTVVTGVGIINESKRSFSSGFDRYIVLDAFAKEKIRIQYKDHSVLGPQTKIKFRIAPASRRLTQFEVLK